MNSVKAPTVFAVVLSWNNPVAVLECLRSLYASEYPALQSVVVDNASTDDTVSQVRTHFPQTTVIANARNLGFARGCNVGIEHALHCGADFVFLVNQDSVVAPHCISALCDFAVSHPRAGILGPKTYGNRVDRQGRPVLLYTGAWRRHVPLQQRIPGIGTGDDGTHDEARQTDYAWGHGFYLRSAMLRQIGLLDAGYLFYYEDLDLCRRATDAGWESWYVPAAQMWHDVADGARADRSEPWRWRCKVKGMRRFHRKYYGRWAGELLTLFTVADMSLRMAIRSQRTGAKDLATAWMREMLARDMGAEKPPNFWESD